jgi:T4 beta protein
MDHHPVYVPVLKGKEGEFAALEALRPEIRARMMPLIEIPGVPYDYANERPAKSLDSHIAGVADRLSRCCPDTPLYLDAWFEDEALEDGRVALEAVLQDCAARGVKAVPVVSRGNSPRYLSAAGNHAKANRIGVCVRLLVEDFEEDIEVDAEIGRILDRCEVGESDSDLVIDLEDLGRVRGRAVLIARSIFSMIQNHGNWRQIVLAAASFPEDLSEVNAATTTTLPRHEWELWKTLQRRPALLPRPDLVFGDYAIAHPEPKELDPRTMRMSASIRYTTPIDWLVVKGRNVRQYGFDQYFDLCKTLLQRPEYMGKDFSWGDNYISECAAGKTGPGNATTWRKVGTNHHLTLAAQEAANLRRAL